MLFQADFKSIFYFCLFEDSIILFITVFYFC